MMRRFVHASAPTRVVLRGRSIKPKTSTPLHAKEVTSGPKASRPMAPPKAPSPPIKPLSASAAAKQSSDKIDPVDQTEEIEKVEKVGPLEVSTRSVPELPRKSSFGAEDAQNLDNTMVAHLSELESAANAADSMSDDWANSFQGLGSAPFPQRVIDILLAPVEPTDVEITPDGLIYLPEIKYRRVLNRAFGPGGWGIAPRTKTMVTKRQVTREYGLVCLGRLVSVSRGEMDFFSSEGVTTAMEGCKSNALMRCCKDLGIASELWDPMFIRDFKQKHCESKYFEKRKRFVWKRKDRQWEYPYN